MQVFKYIFVVGVLVLLSQGALAATPVFGKASETRYARHLTPPQGKALIYIYERGQGGGISPKIWLNNYEIGSIVPGSFTVWQLAPGRLELRVDGSSPANLSLVSQAGKVYLFRLDVTGDSAEIESLPQSYRSDLASLRLIKNPRQMVAAATPPPSVKPMTPQVATASTQTEPKPRPRHYDHTQESRHSGGMTLMLKTGSFSLGKQNQTIVGVNTTFKKSASGVYDAELDSQFSDGVTIGGELLGFKANYTSSNGSGDVAATAILANAKIYFRTHSHLQPYFGVGFGLALADASGALVGKSAGFAYQVLAGLEYRISTIGVFAEAKYLGADTKDSNGNKLDATGSGILGGVAFHF